MSNEVVAIPRGTASRPPAIQYQVSDIELMARAIAGSKLFGIQSPEQALALCLIAQSEGRHPASAAQDYHIIQGKPSKKADAMLRDFINAGGKVEWHALDDKIADATFSHPGGGSVRISWDMDRAKKAQLTTQMWSKYPRQMLRSRVVSEGVRTVYPMATSGMYVPEEVQEFAPQIEGQAVPQRTSHRLKQEGGDDIFKSITMQVGACTSVPDLQALHKKYAATIATWPDDWQATFASEIYDPKLAELQDQRKHAPRAKPLSDEESAKVRATLIAALYLAKNTAAITDWRDANADAFRTMSKADQRTVADERDARTAELWEQEQSADGDGVVHENILSAG